MSVSGHTPPPFFNRGLPPQAKLALYLVLSLALLVGDLKFHYLETVRQGVAILTYPLQMAAATPVEMLRNTGDYLNSLQSLQRDNTRLKDAQLKAASRLLRYNELERENHSLRQLLQMHSRLQVKSTAAQVLYAARDPFSHRVIIDKGYLEGIEEGLLAIDSAGVIGQVSRAFPLHSEVTLISDKNQAIHVMLARSGLRAILFGLGNGLLELRYLAANADVQVGDRISTSGLDGTFVPGLPVAVVMRVDRDSSASFARILCRPLAGVEQSNTVLIVGRVSQGIIPREPSGTSK